MKTTPAARAEWRRRRAAIFRTVLAPPPRLTVSEWADRYRMLSSEASAEPGKWRTERAPYQRGILDAFSDPMIEHVVVMSAAQVGKTEIINNIVGFFIDQDPSPILVIQPTLEMAEAWSKDRLAPMLRDTPRLRGKVAPARARDSGNTLLHKNFPGGNLTVVGANSPSSLASRPKRVVLGDERDRYPPSAGTEGNPWALGVKRTSTFWNRKLGEFSTPTLKGFSEIEAAFERSDRRRYHVPCPDCGHFQVLRWAQLKWESGKPETAAYCCEGCGTLIDEAQKGRMLAGGIWLAENPGARIAGFHLNALYSPWARWEELVCEFLASRGNAERMKVFTNTVLGETWEEEGEQVGVGNLKADGRRDDYEAGTVPVGVGLLTAGVDVQGDRLELKVKGWGKGEESWLILWVQIWGDPGRDEVWKELEGYLSRTYPHTSGAQLHISAVCIDSGGHHTEQVYRFVKGRQGRGVWAVKGANQPGRPIWGRPGKMNKHGARLVTIGTDTAKDLIFSRLKLREPGPGFMHLPLWADDEYLAQLTAEKVVTRYSRGRPFRRYEKVRPRNEALDLEVYALAALLSLGPVTLQSLGRFVDELGEAATREDEDGEDGGELEPPAPPPPPRKPPWRGGWVNSWR